MSTSRLLLLLFLGLLVLADPIRKVGAQDEDDDYEGEEFDEGEGEEETEFDEKDVVVLTQSTFSSIISENDYVLAEFYAPWCGHCKQLAPEWAKAATMLKEVAPSVVLGKVDATVEEELGKEYNVEGFPSIKWFVHGEVSDYDGGREAKEIVSWVRKQTGPPAETAEDAAQLEALIGSALADGGSVIVGLFDKFEGAEWDSFQKAAKADTNVPYVQTLDAAAAKAKGVSESAPAVALIKESGVEADAVPFDGEFDAEGEKIVAFAGVERMPLVTPFKQSTAEMIFGCPVTKQLILFSPGEALEEGEDLIKTYTKIAGEMRGFIVFVSVDTDTEESTQIAQYFGVDPSAPAAVVGYDTKSGNKFKPEGSAGCCEEAMLLDFATKFKAGELKPFVKSEEVPEDPLAEGAVYKVVGETVDTVCKDATKDVMLEIYAPWCGHCKSLAPIYEKLARRFSKVDSVIIGKMDGTENEHPDIEIEGFPTILFFPAAEWEEGKSGHVTYEGERTLKDMTKFLKDNAMVPYELPKKKKGKGEDKEDL